MHPTDDVPELPPGYDTREPTFEDAELVWQLLSACEEAELGEPQVDVEDIRSDWRRPGVDIEGSGVFVLDPEGTVVGYGEVIAGRAEGNVLPTHEGRGIGTYLAAWIERRARSVGSSFVRQVVPATATARLELLHDAGYAVSDTAWELEIARDELGARPPMPDGYEFRDFRPGVDDAAAFQVVEDAFAPWPNREPNTLGGWKALTIDRAGFEPWMLAPLWVGDELVGVAYCIDYPEDQFAWIQQLAIREDQRGRGLGTQLLHEAFGRFGDRGRSRFGLATDSRTGALGLYRRVGMRVVREFAGHTLRVD